MTTDQRRAAAEEIERYTGECDFDALSGKQIVDAIAAILARHDSATVGDAALHAAEEITVLLPTIKDGMKLARIIPSAISASERELVEALKPVITTLARYYDIDNKRDEFLLVSLSTGKETVRLTAGMVRTARAVLANRGRK